MPEHADKPVVEFFFDQSCPWTYLAFTRIQETVTRVGARIAWKPILVDEVHRAANRAFPGSRVDPNPAKARYQAKDLQDWARFCGIRIRQPEHWPITPVLAQSGAVVADAAGRLVAFVAATFEAYFDGAKDITDPEVIGAIAERAGLERQRFGAALQKPETRAVVEANGHELVRRGGFGSPTMFVGEDMYFGNDRMPLVEIALARASDRRFVMPFDHRSET